MRFGIRPQNFHRKYGRNANVQGKIGDIFATGHQISTSCLVLYRVFGVADRMALFPVWSNPRWRPDAILENFEWPYPRNGPSDPLYVWLQVFCGGRQIRKDLLPVEPNTTGCCTPSSKIPNEISLEWVIRSTFTKLRVALFGRRMREK